MGEERNGVEECSEEQERSPSFEEDTMDNNNAITSHSEYKLTTVFKGWFSYHKLAVISDPRLKQKSYSNSPKFSNGIFGCFRKVIRGCRNKRYTRIVIWKAK